MADTERHRDPAGAERTTRGRSASRAGAAAAAGGSSRPGPVARLMLDRLARIRRGHLVVRLPDGSVRSFAGGGAAPVAELRVHRWRFFTRVLRRGDVGAGESYVDGDWSSSDLVTLARLFLDNERELAPPGVLGAIGRLLDRLNHLRRSNTRGQARRNIHAHYDLSNELYALFLDPSMTYSCALFDGRDLDLEAAQRAKYRRLAEWARLRPGQHVLEIGCGWGGFAEFAVAELDCRVTGITLSEAQATYARRRLADRGFERRAEIRVVDYRDVDGRFDAVVSIEMLEAVGHRYLDAFFATCDRLLAPGGRLALQTITIPDQAYDRYRRGSDWIRAYVFPGGHLPSLGAIQGALARTTNLAIRRLEDHAGDYAATLRLWRERFRYNAGKVLELGFDERFLRTWEFYLASCEAAFRERQIGVLQLALARTGRRPDCSGQVR